MIVTVHGGRAARSHPWLLHQLSQSLGLGATPLSPLPETVRFLDELNWACAQSTMSAAGALGAGGELLVIPEYSAMKRAFAAGWPVPDYARFFNANIKEDERHALIMETAAHSLAQLGHDGNDFLAGAIRVLNARVSYYDRLASRSRSKE